MKRVLVTLAIAAGVGGRVHAATPGMIDDRDQGSGPSTSDPGPDPSAASQPKRGPGGGEAQPAPAPQPPLPPATTAAADGEERLPPRRRFSVMPRFAYRLGDAGRAVKPAPGFGVGGTIEISYARLAAGAAGAPTTPDRGALLEAALGIDFSHDRFSVSEQGSTTVDGMMLTFGSTRVVSETSFVLVHTVAARLGDVRPYLTIGAGLGLGYFDSAERELRPGTAREAHLLGRAAFGVDLKIARSLNVAIRADFTAVRGASPLITDTGRRLPIFGDLLDLGAGIAYRF